MKRSRKRGLALSKKTIRILNSRQLGRMVVGQAATDPQLTMQPCSSSELSVELCTTDTKPITNVCPPDTL